MREHAYKIWYRELDENGNAGPTKVFPRDYIYYGTARNVAIKHFGDRTKYEYRVEIRDPWVEYSQTITCELCGKQVTLPETVRGIVYKPSCFVHMPESEANIRVKTMCPDCASKIEEFITSLNVTNQVIKEQY